jgi:hypothetical protein
MRHLLNALSMLVCLAATAPAAAAELQPRTSRAYDAYLEQARRAFLSRIERAPSPAGSQDGVLSAGPGGEDGIVNVEGGLVHHWIGAAFVRGATLRSVINVSRAYSDYSAVYTSVIGSRVLAHEGDTYRVLIRLEEGEAGITAVLDVRSTIRYFQSGNGGTYALSNADEIREVRNAGERDEHLLPAGRDSGYLWRANTFTRFIERDGGVYVEMETLGLSREFPPLLGWLIEPIARRLGRKSVESSLREFLAAVRAAA